MRINLLCIRQSQQEEYREEQIKWSYVSFIDNQDVLEMIQQGPDGVLPLLDEQCRLPSGTDKGYVENLKTRLANHPRFSFAKKDPNAFNISHFAGDVTYSGISFLEKNKDYVIQEHMELIGSCEVSLMKSFQVSENSKQSDGSPARTGRQFSSVTNRFQKELLQLVGDLAQTDPHYIRCVKPNEMSAPMVFSGTYIADQLRCGGVLEAVRVLQAGFPTKRTYRAFCQAYYKLLDLQALAPMSEDEANNKQMTVQILKAMAIHDYQLGRTKVFLRAGQLASLETRKRHLLNESATVIQRHARGFLARQRYTSLSHPP